MANDESPFQPMGEDEKKNLIIQNQKSIVEDLAHIKQILLKLRNVDMLECTPLADLTENLQGIYNADKDEEYLKRHSDGISETLKSIDKFSEVLLRSYTKLLGELKIKGNLDTLIRDLDQRLDEFNQNT